MSLLQQIEKEYLSAYKAKESVKVAVLRMLKTAIKNSTVELRRDPTDDEVLDLIARQAKQRKESIEQFEKGGRPELADNERLELDVLNTYMPAQLSEDELAKAVDKAIAELGASGMQDMGKVMQAVMAAHKGQVDGKLASALVRSKLA